MSQPEQNIEEICRELSILTDLLHIRTNSVEGKRFLCYAVRSGEM